MHSVRHARENAPARDGGQSRPGGSFAQTRRHRQIAGDTVATPSRESAAPSAMRGREVFARCKIAVRIFRLSIKLTLRPPPLRAAWFASSIAIQSCRFLLERVFEAFCTPDRGFYFSSNDSQARSAFLHHHRNRTRSPRDRQRPRREYRDTKVRKELGSFARKTACDLPEPQSPSLRISDDWPAVLVPIGIIRTSPSWR